MVPRHVAMILRRHPHPCFVAINQTGQDHDFFSPVLELQDPGTATGSKIHFASGVAPAGILKRDWNKWTTREA